MSWILFSILAAVCWSVVNVVDKYILTKWVKEPIVPVMILGFVGLMSSFIIFFINGFVQLSYYHILLAIIGGVFYMFMNILYFKAVKIEEISRVIPLFYLTPLFVLVLATIFLKEIFTPIKYMGIILLVIGAILISMKKFQISFGKAFWFMIIASFSLSIYSVLIKYLLNFADFWTIFAYLRIGVFIALIPFLYSNFRHLISTVRENGIKVVFIIGFNESLNLFAVLLFTLASSIGFVTLVNAIASVQPFFVLLFAVIFSIFYPQTLKEEINKSTMFIKLTEIVLIFIGSLLII